MTVRIDLNGSGDALTVHFDAADCPPLPAGWTRDYLLFLDGWAKDRDPNTLEALAVEPEPLFGVRTRSSWPRSASALTILRTWTEAPFVPSTGTPKSLVR